MAEKVYKKAYIYKIISNNTDKIYIGSTSNKLCKRLAKHKYSYKRYKKNEYAFMTSFLILEKGDYYIEKIKSYYEISKKQLQQKEKKYIKKYKQNCVNKIIPGRTCKEYVEEHKDKVAEYRKQYYNDKKEKILQDQKEYRLKNKKEIYGKLREYYQKNKEEINKKQSEKFECECGGRYTRSNKSQHKKSVMHQDYLESLED